VFRPASVRYANRGDFSTGSLASARGRETSERSEQEQIVCKLCANGEVALANLKFWSIPGRGNGEFWENGYGGAWRSAMSRADRICPW
jgi:hypothetical protein